jgi:hypothetical protein
MLLRLVWTTSQCYRLLKDFFPNAVGEPSLAVLGAEDNVIEKLLMSAHEFSPWRFLSC